MKEKRISVNAKFGEATKVVRLPLTLANFLQQYPTVINELVSQIADGELNLAVSVTACNSVTDTDIEAMVNNAVESRLEAVLSQVKNLRLDVHSITTTDLITQNLQANLTVAQQRLDALEAITTAKKPLMQLVKERVIAA